MDEYRNIAMQMVAEPEHRPTVEAIAEHLHYNESLHLHDCTEGPEPCSYCWLRAAKAVQAIERDGQRIGPNQQFDNIRKDRDEVRKENERLQARLKAAEDVCVMLGWSAAHHETDRQKATHELWSRWRDLVPDEFTDPAAHPDLSDEEILRLAARRDETRARTLAKIRSEG